MFKNAFDVGLLLLRLAFGSMMIYGHGWGKLMRFFADDPIKFSDPIGVGVLPSLVLAVFAEVVCSFLVSIGWLTRWAVIPLAITMFVASFISHGGDPFSRMEKPLMYLVVFIAIFLLGPGKYSVDGLLKKKA